MRSGEFKNKLFLTLGICAAVAIFFLLTVQVWDNTGAKFNYTSYGNSENEIVINSYTGNPVDLEIPREIDGYTVVAIGKGAFAENTELKKVTIPSSVKYINDYAFSGCKSLKSVTVDEGLESIGYRAFYKCVYLRNMNLPTTLKKIDDEAFRECERLKTLTIPKNCEEIGNEAFRACMSLTLDCSQNDMAKEYAQDYYIPTSFAQSTDYTHLKVFGLTLIAVVIFVAVVVVTKKLFGKKEEVEIRFVDSEMSRRDKYKDGLVSDDPSKRTSAKRMWLSKKADQKPSDDNDDENESEVDEEAPKENNNSEKD